MTLLHGKLLCVFALGGVVSHAWQAMLAAHTWTILGLMLIALIVGHLTSRAAFFVTKSQANRLEAENYVHVQLLAD